MYGEMFEALGVYTWIGDDATIQHDDCPDGCGKIEPDAEACRCGEPNPLRELGFI